MTKYIAARQFTENGKRIALRFACMRTRAKKDGRWISTAMDIECIMDCLAIRPVSHYFGCMAGAALVKIGNTFLRIHQLASDSSDPTREATARLPGLRECIRSGSPPETHSLFLIISASGA